MSRPSLLLRVLPVGVGLFVAIADPALRGANPCERFGQPKEVTRGTEAVVVGTPYVVPDLRLRFSGLGNGEPVTPEVVRVFYIWSEVRDGEWGQGIERVNCTSAGDELIIPSYTVRPRSWQTYWYSFLPWKKPRFEQIEVDIDDGKCSSRAIIWRSEIGRYRGKTLHVKLTCAGLPEYWLEAPDGTIERVSRDNGAPYDEQE